MAKADIELLFGVKGGGDVAGESGSQIQKELESIVSAINKNPLEIEIQLSKKSVSDFTDELVKLTQTAQKEAAAIQAAYAGIVFPQIPTQPVGGGKSKNIILGTDTTDYFKAIARVEAAYSSLNTKLKNWTAASGGKSDKAYRSLEGQRQLIKDLIRDLNTGTMTSAQFGKRMAEIASKISTASREIKSFNEDCAKIVTLTRGTEDYDEALAGVNKTIKALKDNQINWTAAESGSSKAEYAQLGALETTAAQLKTRLESGTLSANDFWNELEQIELRASAAASAIRLVGENVKSGKAMETYRKQIEKVNTSLAKVRKALSDWTAAKTGPTSDSYRELEQEEQELAQLQQQLINTGGAVTDFDQRHDKAMADFAKSSGKIKTANKDYKAFGDRIKELADKFSSWLSVSQVIMKAIQIVKSMVKNVVALDTAMTELKKVTDETDATYSRFLEKVAVRAKQLGAAMTDVVTATADFARLGYDIEDASTLADAAIVYKNVGDGIESISQASESIISTMQAFGIEAKDAMMIVDKFNIIGNKFAISSTGIGEALLNSAASLDAAGNTLDESIAMITATNEVIQSPEKVGTAMKTLSMYLRAAKTEAEEAGISTDGMANSVSELREEILALTGKRIDIMENDGDFKSTIQIVRELSAIWGSLTETTQANLTELIGGGVRNANVISALMNNFQRAEEVLKTTAESSGSALAENEKYLDSIQGKLDQFKASIEALSSTVINNNLIKVVVDAGTMLVNVLNWVVDTFGALGLAVSAVPIASFIKNTKLGGDILTALQGAAQGVVGGSKLTLL